MQDSARQQQQGCFNETVLARRILVEHPVLAEKISAALSVGPDQAVDALREVLRFMYLVAHNPSGKLTPSHRVDLAWHEFILCTKAYQEFCEAVFAHFIHHFPGGSKQENSIQLAKTWVQYEEAFGEPDAHFWGPPPDFIAANCGSCESL